MKHIWKICIITLLTLFILAACARQPRVSTTINGPGDYYFTINSQNEKRGYYVHVPPSYDENTATPLV